MTRIRSRGMLGRSHLILTGSIGSPLLLVAAGALAAAALLGPRPAGAALRCEMLPAMARSYTQNHVRYRMVTDEIEQRLIDTYIRRLDPSRSLLLVKEVDQIRVSLAGIIDKVAAGDCSQLKEPHRKMMEKRQEEESFVRDYVSAEDFELDTSVELVLDPEKRKQPTTRAQRDEVLVSLIHFQLSNYVSAGTEIDEAKQRLIHRYELRTRRLAALDNKDLYADYLDSFAVSLDPHSSYLAAEMLEDFRISMSLSLEGIGVALSERDGYSVAERIIPGGAADRHGGLEPKDKIIAVAEGDGEAVNIIDMPLREAVSLIRGKKGTPVRLTILRQGDKTERFSITIIRDKIDLSERAAKVRYEERDVGGKKLKLGILELPSFYGDSRPGARQSTSDVKRLLAEVREAQVDGLVLDLSRNGGGLLEHAVLISGYFLRKGEIVGIQNAMGRKQILTDRDANTYYSGPLVVHTSRVSASAAEIVAGALKDYGRAVIAGDDHTFGKGTVQTVSTLSPGQGALKITTAMYFRPGGQSTQNDGVNADVLIPSLLSGEDFGESTQRYSLPGRTITAFLGDEANSADAVDHWRPIDAATIKALAERSRRRIDESEEFAEIREKIEKARNRPAVVRLSEILEEREEARANDDEDEGESGDTADAAEEALSPQVEEALNVLADLIAMSGPLGDAAFNQEKPSSPLP